MSLQGPLVVVAENPGAGLAGAVPESDGFPIVEATPATALDAIAAAKAGAVVLADPHASADAALAADLARHVTGAAPFIPVIARIDHDTDIVYREALPVPINAPKMLLRSRITAALRVRTLHGAVLRRAETVRHEGFALPIVPKNDPLEDATVILAGRGRSHPALTVAVGESAGVIGALSVETAARYLKDREVDGLVVGDGFPAAAVDGLLTVLREDSRFRDLPVGALAQNGADFDDELNIVTGRDPVRLVAHLLPYVRLHAFEARLKRIMTSLDREGMIDPDTGLLRPDTFTRELDRAIRTASDRGVGLSVARFALPDDFGLRAGVDAARLVSRLVRGGDFGCRQDDGSILVTFAETDLRHAHVVARRLASVLKHTMLKPDQQRQPVAPAVTLAGCKSTDNVATLLTRVMAPAIAAE